MEGTATAPKESVFRSILWATGYSILAAAIAFAVTLGTAPIRAYCATAVGTFGLGFIARRVGNWDNGRPKSYRRIALESLMATAAMLLVELVVPLLDGSRLVLLPVRFYLWYGSLIFLMWSLFGISERRRLENSAKKRAELDEWSRQYEAKRREELEKSSWEYEAKRRVEEMKSAP